MEDQSLSLYADGPAHAAPRTEPPDESLLCPITQLLMRDPVILSSGHAVELDALVKFWRTCPFALANPVTREPMRSAEDLALVPGLHLRGAIDAYVRRIVVNETTSAWRRPWHRRERATDQLPETAVHHDRYDDGGSAALWDVVRSLPPRARAVVVLRYYEQLSEAETAQALGISVGTVKSQSNRALRMLRERTPDHLHPREEER